MGIHAEIVVPRYVVLTRLADSWIPRASHADPENAEAEAFRWRRIYGPRQTRVAELWVPEQQPETQQTPAPSDQFHQPVASARPCHCLPWRDAALRAFALYLCYNLAGRALDLLILLAS
ncbi:MAG TPA: hypothetical protein VF194_17485 [Ferrovibrio sp.]|jgi:hypothetical protein|uniref:hypothetical protein n=1 Tax=Ferrovibrio sp. TaxID=1917215 RepID=UPI002ECFDB98